MELKRTRELLPEVMWREASASTNAELRDLVQRGVEADAPVPHGALLATANQTEGRGRLDRSWLTPPGTALAVSVLVRGFGTTLSGVRAATADVPDWGELGPAWLPLIAGSAVQGALQPFFTAACDGETDGYDDELVGFEQREVLRVGVKWPNDVHVRDEDDAIAGRPGKKLCGILCELLPDGSAIVGMGINVLIPEWELPTDRATSLLAAGAAVGEAESFADAAGAELADRLLAGVASELMKLAELAGTHPSAARNRVLRNSLTIGTEVRVHLPGGGIVDGRARALAADGSLVVDLPTGGELTVSAGDVEHLR
ncbi:biotin--[acetyl-CoA-carboxylase] ligase [Leucobacter salsicius]|uniref:biotin--[acetyl-CoA-carboxylase] ligase n=1 Tax=Leucobacter salsicius TaxID=664638 RepID=UPI0003497FD3|nr:biotin--[acetyl-CoA-carboxylase] ligase [Leucobacter salsicius]